jgi:hypothetical protein
MSQQEVVSDSLQDYPLQREQMTVSIYALALSFQQLATTVSLLLDQLGRYRIGLSQRTQEDHSPRT